MTEYTLFGETIGFINRLYSLQSADTITVSEKDRRNFTGQNTSSKQSNSFLYTVPRYEYKFCENSDYFAKRGFSENALKEFKMRKCHYLEGKFANRSIIPHIDDRNKYVIGLTGRTEINEEPKWTYSTNFPAGTTLFNYHRAAEYISRNRICILTEGPLDVIRLWESGIYNSVALWGTSLSEAKKYLLDRLGVNKLILALDNDKAGNAGYEVIKNSCRLLYNIERISLPEGKDVADLNINKVKEIFNV